MEQKNLLKFLVIMLFMSLSAITIAQPSWTYTNTGANHTILVQTGVVTISGSAISAGDYIGVFFIDGTDTICGGFAEWIPGSSNAVSAWGDDTSSPDKDGFDSNEAFIWKVWRASDGQVIDMVATYSPAFPSGGTYTTNGMSAIASMTGNAVVLPLGASGTTMDVLCFGSATGSIDMTATGGTPPYNFVWSNGATTEDLIDVATGIYNVTVTDAASSSPVMPWTYTNTGANHTVLVQPGVVTVNGIGIDPGDYIGVFFIDGTDTICGGHAEWITGSSNAVSAWGDDTSSPDKDGFAASEPFIWRVWKASDGAIVDMTATYSPVFPNQGTYTTNGMSSVASMTGTYTPIPGASIILSFTINEPAAILIAGVTVDASCNGIADGSIDATVSGGTGPFTYLWSNGETTEDISVLMGGSYWITATDFNGCIDSMEFVVNEPMALDGQTVVDQPTCFGGNGNIFLTVTGGTSPYNYLWNNGETTQDLMSVPEALYLCTITDANGCTVIAPGDVYAGSAVSVDGLYTTINCFGDNTGSINTNVYGGNQPYDIIWSNGATTEDLFNLVAGTYTITVTDANGCVVVDSYIITQPDELMAVSSVSNISCFGMNDGSVDLTVSGGVTPYTYFWSSGHTSEDLASLSAGNFDVTITDANSCTYTDNFSISEPLQLTANLATTDPLCYMAEGNIDVTVAGGSLPYSFMWSNNEITEDITAMAGTYDVTVTDNSGCSVFLQASLTEPTLVVYSSTIANISCFGLTDGSITGMTSGGVAPYTYAWSNAANTESLTGIGAGTYEVTITDANGCTLIVSQVITEPTEIVLVTMATDISCYGANDGSITVDVSGGSAPYSYTWSNAAITANQSGLMANDYDLTVTDANGCTQTETVTINEPVQLTATFTSVDALCYQGLGSIDVTVAGGTSPYTYLWSEGSAIEDIDVVAGTYDLTITDDNACTTSLQVIITEPTELLLTVGSTSVSCFGGNDGSTFTTVSGGTAPYTYLWDNGATTDGLLSMVAGNYSLTVTDANGCTSVGSTTINEPTQLVITVDLYLDILCFGSTSGFINVSADGGTTPYTYLWSNGETTNVISQLGAGDYTVTVTDANGCFESQTITLTEPSSSVDATFILSEYYVLYNISAFGGNDGTVDMTVTGGTAPYTYNWSNGSFDEDLNTLTAGTYDVTVTDANGCTFISSVTLVEPAFVPPIEIVETITDVTCFGGNDGAIDLTVSGGTAPYFFAWASGQTTEDLANLAAGMYIVTITDSFNGSFSGFVTVADGVEVITNLGGDATICDGDSYPLDAGTFAAYQWSNGDTTQVITVTIAGTYTVTVYDINGCEGTDDFVLSVNPLPAIDLGPDFETCAGTVVSIDGGIWTSYLWSTGETTSSIEVSTSDTYILTVTDANGCSASDDVVFTVHDLPIVDLGVDTTICNGATITLDAGAGNTYVWSTSETTQTLEVGEAGTYGVTVTNMYGCENTDEIAITLSPIVTLDADAGICEGDIYTLDAGVFETYVWSNGETTQSIEITTEDTYSVTVTDANACEGNDDFYLTVYPLPIVDFGTDTVFVEEGNTIILDPGVTGDSYEWESGETTSTIEVGVTGRYTVTVTDVNGCSGDGSVYVQTYVGISDIDAANNINIYPNPVSDNLNISYQNLNIEKVAIFNSIGKQIEVFVNFNDEFTFNTESLPEGIYFIKFITSDNIQITKPFTVIK